MGRRKALWTVAMFTTPSILVSHSLPLGIVKIVQITKFPSQMITLGHIFNRQNSPLSSMAVYIPKLISENYLHGISTGSLRKPLHLN